jgi:hypothetical protein
LFNVEFEVNQKNVFQPNSKSDENRNRSSSQKSEGEEKVSSKDIHHDDQPKRNSHGDTQSNQVNYLLYKKIKILF